VENLFALDDPMAESVLIPLRRPTKVCGRLSKISTSRKIWNAFAPMTFAARMRALRAFITP